MNAPRILLIGESIALAHLARPAVLARWLHERGYEVHFACATCPEVLKRSIPGRFWSIPCIGSTRFFERIAWGQSPYSSKELIEYARSELKLIDQIKPDLVIGDFRLSLSTSARSAGVPFIALTNAYWSPSCELQSIPAPDLWSMYLLGVPLTDLLFQRFYPLLDRFLVLPLNRLRRYFGLPIFESFKDAITAGDYTWYADVPSLIPLRTVPSHHAFIGPLEWSPELALPDQVRALPADYPLLYISLGSSGPLERLLPKLINGLAAFPGSVLLSTAHRIASGPIPPNIIVEPYVSGLKAAQRAQFVVTNGGSPSTYQALSAGKPVIGIATNMDQLLNMVHLCKRGAGLLLRGCSLTSRTFCAALDDMRSNSSYQEHAQVLAGEFATFGGEQKVRLLMEQIIRHPLNGSVHYDQELYVN